MSRLGNSCHNRMARLEVDMPRKMINDKEHPNPEVDDPLRRTENRIRKTETYNEENLYE